MKAFTLKENGGIENLKIIWNC